MMFVLAAVEVWNPIIVGLVVGLPATLFGVKAYRRAEALDKAAAQAAVISAKGDEIQRAFDAFDRIVANLQTDNVEVRKVAADLREQLAVCRAAFAELQRASK